jgi:predicted Rossmann fold nucleotide-binding protein DprA/Smf involved in DNA uptake
MTANDFNYDQMRREECQKLIPRVFHIEMPVDEFLSVVAPEFMPGSRTSQTKLPLGSTPAETAIIEQLAQGVRDGDQLQKATQLPATEFNTALTMLELTGAIRSLGANQWTLV